MRCPMGCLPSRKLWLTGLPGPFTEDRWHGYYVRVMALPRPLHSLDTGKQFLSSYCVPGAVCNCMRQVRQSMSSGSSHDPESLHDASSQLCKVRHLCSKMQSRAQGKGEAQNAKRKEGFSAMKEQILEIDHLKSESAYPKALAQQELTTQHTQTAQCLVQDHSCGTRQPPRSRYHPQATLSPSEFH